MEYRITPSVGPYSRRILMNLSDWNEGKLAMSEGTFKIEAKDRDRYTFRNPSKCDTFISWEDRFDIKDWDSFLSYLHSLGFKENPNLEIL